jgi:uncharacterized membrane protein
MRGDHWPMAFQDRAYEDWKLVSFIQMIFISSVLWFLVCFALILLAFSCTGIIHHLSKNNNNIVK